MSKITDKTSGKTFEQVEYSTLSSSIAASSDSTFNGRKFDPIGIDKIPRRLKDGDQAKFVDLTKVATGSGAGVFRDTVDGVVYVPFKKKDFQNMSIGSTSFIKETFNTDSYQQISASFAAKFNNINDNTLITYLVEEFYTGSTIGGFTGPVTASFNTFTPDGLTSSFSGIDEGDGYNMTFDFSNSNFVTNQSIVFPIGGEANTLRTATFIPTFQHKFIHSGSNRTNKALITSSLASVNGILGLDAAAISPPSGSDCGIGILVNINGTNANAGTYSKNIFKGRVGGDADSGSIAAVNEDLLISKEYVIYPVGTTVASASYHFLSNQGSFLSPAARAAAVTSSTDIREVFFVSGSTNDALGRVGGAHTGSSILDVAQGFGGSLAHADPLLRTTASMGFYCLSGSQGSGAIIINVITSSRDNEGNNLGGAEMKIPRFEQKVPL